MPQALICRSIVLLVSGYSAGAHGALLPASVFGSDATTTPDAQVVAKLAAAFLKHCFSQLWRWARRIPGCSRRPDRQGVSTNTYWKRQSVLDWSPL
jgi:hypothetical protein